MQITLRAHIVCQYILPTRICILLFQKLPYTYFFIDLMLFVVIQIKLHSNLCSNYIYFFNDRTLILVSLSDKHNKNKD